MSKAFFEMAPEGAFEPRPGGGMRLHGGKGSSAPPPDPRLIEAQIKSMGIQDDVIQRIMRQSESMQPLQQAQMEFGLQTARTAYDQSQQDREWTLGKRAQLDAAQRPLLDMASSYNEDDRRAQMYGEATADITQAFDSAEAQGMRTMSRMGVNPNDGKMAAMVNQNNISEALAKAAAGSKASEAARAEGIQLKSNAANMLSGYPSMGMQNTAAGAGFGASGLGLANAGAAGMNAGFNAAGGMAGQMGQNATSMYGAQASYKNSQDQIAASSNPFAALLGAGAQLGAAAIGKSDRRLKKDIKQVGRDERTGLNLYAFRYINGDSKRYIGVMADEVLAHYPDAVSVMPDGFMAVDYAMLGLEMVEAPGEHA